MQRAQSTSREREVELKQKVSSPLKHFPPFDQRLACAIYDTANLAQAGILEQLY